MPLDLDSTTELRREPFSAIRVHYPCPDQRRGFPYQLAGTRIEITNASAQSGDRPNRLTMTSVGSILIPCVVMLQRGAVKSESNS